MAGNRLLARVTAMAAVLTQAPALAAGHAQNSYSGCRTDCGRRRVAGLRPRGPLLHVEPTLPEADASTFRVEHPLPAREDWGFGP